MKKSLPNLIISEPHIVIPKDYWSPRLGEILLEADLITPQQLTRALNDQAKYPDLCLGEILVIRGWLKQRTADFFATKWSNYLKQERKYRLGEYLKKAALLDERKIEQILAEQRRLGLKFGAVAVLNGWINPGTLDFFIEHLFPERQHDSCLTVHQTALRVHKTSTRKPEPSKQPEI
ncbi:hypothetical protein PCC8801_1225 [Rippkaea orientalis PCC 8801]|uniref:Uncharacterized protein n=1 Tax=Rippkaea orientalis (strain PCC 8801 / RF-1) TaxID=41431 RepID=B7K3E9_RIPO1|nr:hypothetical protein [Rippkaea orientalis]ACK65291.1 hypothetical protein PCC8801_1225 [Rippkaea orientalis PCC 8801]